MTLINMRRLNRVAPTVEWAWGVDLRCVILREEIDPPYVFTNRGLNNYDN